MEATQYDADLEKGENRLRKRRRREGEKQKGELHWSETLV